MSSVGCAWAKWRRHQVNLENFMLFLHISYGKVKYFLIQICRSLWTINVKNILVYQTAIGIMWNYCYKISANFSKMKLFAKWNQKPNLETDQLLLLKELLLSNWSVISAKREISSYRSDLLQMLSKLLCMSNLLEEEFSAKWNVKCEKWNLICT